MNTNLLDDNVQKWINDHLKDDVSSLVLKGSPFENISIKELAEQIKSKRKSEKKLPKWFNTPGIIFPKSLSIEQTSSEITAKHKADHVHGNIIDITGGFGVDTYYFSLKDKSATITHMELQGELSKTAMHNFKKLNASNIECINANGIDYVISNNKNYAWIYLDPARRNDSKGKVFLLADCTPNVTVHLNDLLNKSENILIKTSPMLDIHQGVRELQFVKQIDIIAVNNEVKELLWVIKKKHQDKTQINTYNYTQQEVQKNEFIFNELSTDYSTSEVKKYIYQPNVAILKSGKVNNLCKTLNIAKLAKQTHLFTSDKLIKFPGKTFEVINVLHFNKREIKKQFSKTKANVISKNFPLAVAEIRKNFSIKDGGDCFLFFVTNHSNEKLVVQALKI